MNRALLLVVLATACDGAPARIDLDLSLEAPDGSLPELASPLSADETRALREGFSWTATTALPTHGADGSPTLYYTLAYLDSPEDADALEELGLHYSSLPLFPEERERWQGMTGAFSFSGDLQGVFVFVLMPGAVYDAIREEAIAGEPAFTALVLRDPPAAARGSDGTGSVSLAHLIETGFVYGPDTGELIEVAERTDGISASHAPLIADGLVAAARVAAAAIEELHARLGDTARFALGSAQLDVSVVANESDRRFGAPTRRMRRAWGHGGRPGTNMGEPLWLSGVRVLAYQGPALFRGRADQFGTARLAVSHGRMDVCVELSNHAAEMTSAVIPDIVCAFDGLGRVDISRDTRLVMTIADWRTFVLAQATDSHDYATRVIGVRPQQARYLIGPLPDLIGAFNGSRAATICGGFSGVNLVYETAGVTLIGTALANAAPFSEEARIALPLLLPAMLVVLRADIIMPAGLGRVDRTATHEYGHFLLCDLMSRTSHADLTVAWSDLAVPYLTMGSNPPATQDTMYTVEAWADYFTGQVIGATGYFDTAGGQGDGTDGDPYNYCAPNSLTCFEDNIGGPSAVTTNNSGYFANIGRVTTLFHDFFDRRETGIGDHPNGGAAWQLVPGSDGLIGPIQGSSDAGDEQVQLEGRDMLRWIEHWSHADNRIGERSFVSALVRTARERGFTSDQVCTALSLHSPDGRCDSGALDPEALSFADVTPTTPLALRATSRSESTVDLAWRDVSRVATLHRVRVTDMAGVDMSADQAFARAATRTVGGLRSDTEHVAEVRSLNGTRESAPAQTSFVTLADPVVSVTAEPVAGGVRVSWSPLAGGRTSGGFRVSIVSPPGRPPQNVPDGTTELVLRGLSTVPHVLAVASLNSVLAPSRDVTSTPVTPMAPRTLYVSDTIGNDASPGTAEAPYQSLSRAVLTAASGDIDRIVVESGTFTDGPLVITRSIAIEGGYVRGSPDWTPGGAPSVVRIGAGATATPCTSAAYNRLGRETRAGVVVTPGLDVQLRSLHFVAAFASPTECESVLHATDSALVLENTTLEIDAAAIAGDCRAAAVVLGAGGLASLSIAGATLVANGGSDVAASGDMEVAGLCARGASVSIADLETPGARRPTSIVGWSFPPRQVRVASLVAAVIEDAPSISISRSSLASTLGTLYPPTGAYQAGLVATASSRIAIDNSTVRTAIGCDVNHALELGGPALGSLSLLHVTAAAGSDWTLAGSAAPPLDAAVLVLTGNIADITIANSVLAGALGSTNTSTSISVLDRSRTTADPVRLVFRGNVLAVPLISTVGQQSLVYCSGGELGSFRDETSLNNLFAHPCRGTSTAGWVIGENRALLRRPGAAGPDLAVVALDDTGHLQELDTDRLSLPTLRATGVPLMDLPGGDGALRALDGSARDPAAVPVRAHSLSEHDRGTGDPRCRHTQAQTGLPPADSIPSKWSSRSTRPRFVQRETGFAPRST